MTSVRTITPLPDFETIFRQIVGETFAGLTGHNNEECFVFGLDQTQEEDQLLFETIQAHESGPSPSHNNQQWESLKQKLSQTN